MTSAPTTQSVAATTTPLVKSNLTPKPTSNDVDENKNNVNPVYNVPQWVKKNAHLFVPPICNKLMYNTQLNIMFVGGPNTRKDYHVDCGEEFFYQIKGNMSLPTYQRGKRKLVNIREGQIYLLRSRIPHSPQRPENGSLGLVVERQRVKPEMDALRFYVSDFDSNCKDHSKLLWEKWFFCTNLGTQLVPIVKQFQASDQFKTHKPSATSVSNNPPVQIDEETIIPDPIDLFPYIEKNKNILKKNKCLDIYSGTQTTVRIMTGPFEFRHKYHQETWIYVLKGNCRITWDYPTVRDTELLSDGDCLIINKFEQYKITIVSPNTLIMSVSMDIASPKQDSWKNMKAPL